MKQRSVLIVIALVCLLNPLHGLAQARPEFRAFWADGFNPAFKSAMEIDALLQRLHDAHCNAIFAQMRKGGDAYYQSHYEPWAKDDPTHFDALEYLVRKAHDMTPRIAVHAWINTCAVGGNMANPFNIVHLHPDWLSLNPAGANFDGEATKIDPGNTEAADWTARIYLDVARHYDVDGIHFDFVRYGGPTWGYNPVSVARFEQQVGYTHAVTRASGSDLPAPIDPLWKQWRRDQVTAIVRKVYAQAAAIRPDLVISGAVIAWADAPHSDAEWTTHTAAMNRTFQDWRGWLQEGIIDLACPMTYFQADNHTDWQEHWAEFIKDHQYRRAATMGVGNWFNTIPQTEELMKISRATSATGHRPYGVMLYSYAGTNASDAKGPNGRRTELEYQPEFYAALSMDTPAGKAPFPTDAPIPAMPWKVHPTEGLIKGYVLTPDLAAVDGATVTASGSGRRMAQRTDGTGFYAFVALPPGQYAVKVAAPGFATARSAATVEAGRVVTAHFTLGASSAPITPSVETLLAGAGIPGTPVRLRDVLVTRGTDTFPGSIFVSDGRGVGIRARLALQPDLPFQAGDVAAVNGTLQFDLGEPIIDQAIVRLTDIRPMSALPAPRVVSGTDLANGKAPNGADVRLEGSVVASGAAGFTMDCAGTPVEVTLAGLKDFGVESTGLVLAPPVPGSRMQVSGTLVAVVDDGGAKRFLLRPLSSESMRGLLMTSLWQKIWQNRIVREVAPACFCTDPGGPHR